jgi:hypothetical protein
MAAEKTGFPFETNAIATDKAKRYWRVQ